MKVAVTWSLTNLQRYGPQSPDWGPFCVDVHQCLRYPWELGGHIGEKWLVYGDMQDKRKAEVYATLDRMYAERSPGGVTIVHHGHRGVERAADSWAMDKGHDVQVRRPASGTPLAAIMDEVDAAVELPGGGRDAFTLGTLLRQAGFPLYTPMGRYSPGGIMGSGYGNLRALEGVNLRCFDTETHAMRPGSKTPRPVCVTWNTPEEDYEPGIMKVSDPIDRLRFGAMLTEWLQDPAGRLVIHNAAFDLALAVVYFGVSLKLVMEALEAGRVVDTAVRETLGGIAHGWTSKKIGHEDEEGDWKVKGDPRTGKPFLKRLAACVEAHLGKDITATKKGDDVARVNYHRVEHLPVSEWPEGWADYAKSDVVYPLDVYASQCNFKRTPAGPIVTPTGTMVNEIAQTCASFALHLMAINGPRAERKLVEEFVAHHNARSDEADKLGCEWGWVVLDPKKNNVKRDPRFKRRWIKAPGYTEKKAQLQLRLKEAYGGDAFTAQAKHLTESGQKYLRRNKIKGGLPMAGGPLTWKGKQVERHIFLSTSGKLLKKLYGKVPPDEEERGGRELTAEENLLHLKWALVTYAKAKASKKQVSTYVDILLAAVDYPLSSSPGTLVNTGRTSWAGPNMQNPPRSGGFRECFIARAGKVFVSADYSSVEMATLAQEQLDMFGTSAMAEQINAGRDLHSVLGAVLAGVTYDAFAAARKRGEPWAALYRQAAKAINFGIPGGMAPARVVETYGVEDMVAIATPAERAAYPDDERLAVVVATRMKAVWLALYPEEQRRFDKVKTKTRRNNVFWYKHPISGRVRGGLGYCDGCNTPFQGRAADGIKRALWAVTKACYIEPESPLFGCRPWLMIHDELLLEGPADTAHLWGAELSRIMVLHMRHFTPGVVSEAEPAVMRRWYKSADLVRDADGTAHPGYPWEPWYRVRKEPETLPNGKVVPADPEDWHAHDWVLKHPSVGKHFVTGDLTMVARVKTEAAAGLAIPTPYQAMAA